MTELAALLTQDVPPGADPGRRPGCDEPDEAGSGRRSSLAFAGRTDERRPVVC